MVQLLPYFSSAYFWLMQRVSPFYSRARDFINTRTDIFLALEQWKTNRNGNVMWFHCASLGEFEMARPLMQLLKDKQKAENLLVTFYSPSGYNQRHKDPLPDGVFYLPFDGKKNAERFISIVNPTLVFFVKYDFWPGYLLALKRNRIPVFLVNASFNAGQIYFKWYGKAYGKLLHYFEHIFVQYKQSAILLANAGAEQVSVSGDLRFDRVAQIARNAVEMPVIEKFCENWFTVVAGSSWQPEERLLAETLSLLKNSKCRIKVLLVPHDVSERHLSEAEQIFTDSHCIRLGRATPAQIEKAQVLIVDSVGKLASAYRYGQMAVVGGGFSGKLHNMLEPLVHGLPVITGPITEKFPEAEYFRQKGLAFSVQSPEVMANLITEFYNNPEKLQNLKSLAREEMKLMEGAAVKVYTALYGSVE